MYQSDSRLSSGRALVIVAATKLIGWASVAMVVAYFLLVIYLGVWTQFGLYVFAIASFVTGLVCIKRASRTRHGFFRISEVVSCMAALETLLILDSLLLMITVVVYGAQILNFFKSLCVWVM